MAHILGEDYSLAVSSVFRFIFSLVIFVVYTATAVFVTKRVKYKFTFKVYLNISGFLISMAINLIYGILTLVYQDKLIKYIHYFLLFSGEAGADGLIDFTDFFA